MLPREPQALALFPFYLSGDWRLKAGEVPNLIRVLEPFESQMKALGWFFPQLHYVCAQNY